MDTYFENVTIGRPGYLGGGTWTLDRLRPLTILFGKNSSGKSLLLRGLRDKFVEKAHYVIPERTGSLGFDPGYVARQFNAQTRREASTGNFISEYRQHIVARIEAYLSARGAARETQLPGRLEDIESLISMILPDFALEIVASNPPYRITRTSTNEQVTDVNQMSSGEAQLITIGLDILTIAATWEIQQTTERLMLIDEPDAHVHPDLQARFADFLVQTAKKFRIQFVIATHSTTLLAALGQFAGDDAGVIYLDRTKANFDAQPFTANLKEIAACLGGHALMGPLFGVPLLLVEGDDDYRIWGQVPRHHVTSFAVIPCHGDEIKSYQKHLERIFASLRSAAQSNAGYALLDGDKPLPTPNPDVPQNHVRYLRMNCHEAENLYVTDECLSLIGTDWANASAKIVAAANAGTFGAKSAKLAMAATWNRKDEDLKDVVGEISSIIDDKHVHWTTRVGVAIGRSKPAGQLMQFLGDPVVDALWQ